ncbi:MAG: hypothetical protein OJF61_001943 [Rhodanobacteraceae bacterium]|jgi:hypothetical protein|nr:MAG: hypothetical protein OJF61_001943 [Rhodanobacteraceae bacterium]
MKRVQIAVSAAFSLLLAACATFGQIRDSLQGLMGQPLDVAIQQFGYPASQMQMGDQVVYRWYSNRVIPVTTYNTSTTYGNVGATPFSATTGTMGMTPVGTACELDIGTVNGVMREFSFHGQLVACQAFKVR